MYSSFEVIACMHRYVKVYVVIGMYEQVCVRTRRYV